MYAHVIYGHWFYLVSCDACTITRSLLYTCESESDRVKLKLARYANATPSTQSSCPSHTNPLGKHSPLAQACQGRRKVSRSGVYGQAKAVHVQ